jgi:hypothetical protein
MIWKVPSTTILVFTEGKLLLCNLSLSVYGVAYLSFCWRHFVGNSSFDLPLWVEKTVYNDAKEISDE